MIVQNLFQSNESYTHENWVYRNVSVALSRLYYIIDGEAYCEENGKKTRLKKGYLYLTPVHVPCHGISGSCFGDALNKRSICAIQ